MTIPGEGSVGKNMQQENGHPRILWRRAPFSQRGKLLLRVMILELGYRDIILFISIKLCHIGVILTI